MEQRGNENKLTHLQDQILQYRSYQSVFGFEPHPIVQGDHNVRIMQISQTPSKSMHEAGRPSDGASGRRLHGEWYRISDGDFYSSDHFYIVSMTHCCPGETLGDGDRRPPKICSEQWLLREMELVDNDIYIIIGGIAAEFLFPRGKVTALAFEDKQINGKPAYVLSHPSPLNMKWFKDYPEFTEKRIFEVQKEVHRILGAS